MKAINLKTAFAARKLVSEVEWLTGYCNEIGYRSEKQKTKLEEDTKRAKEAFEAACATLADELRRVQTRCTARTIKASDILSALDKVERRWDIPKKYMAGCVVDVDLHAQTFPSAYHGIPESTQFTAEYKAGSWRITDIRRGQVRGSTRAILATLTDEAKQAILAKYETSMA